MPAVPERRVLRARGSEGLSGPLDIRGIVVTALRCCVFGALLRKPERLEDFRLRVDIRVVEDGVRGRADSGALGEVDARGRGHPLGVDNGPVRRHRDERVDALRLAHDAVELRHRREGSFVPLPAVLGQNGVDLLPQLLDVLLLRRCQVQNHVRDGERRRVDRREVEQQDSPGQRVHLAKVRVIECLGLLDRPLQEVVGLLVGRLGFWVCAPRVILRQPLLDLRA